MRVVIEAGAGELRRRGEELTKALETVFAAEGLDLTDLVKALAPPSHALSDLRPVCLRESVDARLRWYETVVLPAMQERITEVLR